MTPLAHMGGAPEAAVVGLPLLLFAAFYYLERRARRGDPPAQDRTPQDEASE